MSPLDTQLLIRKIKQIREDLDFLAKFKETSLEEYLADESVQLQVERLLERTIGRLIDINFHILKEKYQTLPTDYFMSFTKMAEVGEVPKQLAQDLAHSAGLRNILAHEYDTVDLSKVYQSITIALDQIPKYLEAISSKIN